MEHDRGGVVRLDHAVGHLRSLRPSCPQGLPEQTVADLVPAEHGVDPHVLYPDEIAAVGDVMEHLREDEPVDLPVLLGHEAEAAVEVGLEVVSAAGAQVVAPFLGEFLPFVLQRAGEVLLDELYLQFADLLQVLGTRGRS